jgi:hypothetical protein
LIFFIMRYSFIIIILICLFLSILVLNSCRIGIEELSDSTELQDETSEQSPGEDKSNLTENGGSIDKPRNDVMFYNSEVNFAFIYPQDNLSISSYPYLKGDYGDLSLNININAVEDLQDPEKEAAVSERDTLESGDFGADTGFSLEHSRKVVKISETFVKEFLTLGRYDICDIAFDWEIHFYNNGYQVEIILSADTQKMIESLDQYFTYDEKNCPGQKVWDFNKQDEFYDKLTTGQLTGLPAEWYSAFDSIMYLLQINDFKGASAGYSRLIDERIYEENAEEIYIIDVSYPQFQSAVAGGLNESINKIIYKQKVLPVIDDFKDEVSSYQYTEFSYYYFLTIDYSVVMYDENGISVCLDIYPFLGGAHGMLYFKTINFDLEKMSLVGLEDLFIAGYDYLPIISDYCREDLARQINERDFKVEMQWLEEGTDPGNIDNFINFLVAQSELIIKFPAYQVAPYAAGDFTVNIPYQEFEGNFNPEGMLGNHAGN